MADVFLSYSRVDREKAQTIAQALEAEGLSVWWDKILHAGQTYDEVTENMLRDSKVCVVLWSAVSVKSKWVRAEATLGERSSAVVPAMLEEAERPIMFELTQTADLIGWDGDRSEERWKTFVADIRLALGPVDDAVEVEATPAPAPAPALAPDLDATIETTFWTSIKDGSDPADFEAYLKRYPEGHYSDLARNRLSALATSAVEPEPAPILATPPPEIAAPVSPPVPTASASKTKPSPVLLGAGAVGLLALILVGFGLTGGFGGGNSEATEDVESSVTASQSGTFKDCETCPELIILPAGDFMMGSPTSEAGRAAYEGPRHEVTLPAFAIGRTEVTFEQWDACVTAGGCMGYTPGDRGFGRGSQPALGISWNDATAYVQWLSAT
ncbi:MAG: TIR domain-containing protein, partial [Hyphomonadaceae bacterium]